jgi:hypothetical protein
LDPTLGVKSMTRGGSKTAEASLRADDIDKTKMPVEGEEPGFAAVTTEVGEKGADLAGTVIQQDSEGTFEPGSESLKLERSARVWEAIPAGCEGRVATQRMEDRVGEREAAKDIARILDISAGRTDFEILTMLNEQEVKYPTVLFRQIWEQQKSLPLRRAGVSAEVTARLLEIGNEEVKDLIRKGLSNSKDLRLLPLVVKLGGRALNFGVEASGPHLALLSSAMSGTFEGEAELKLCYEDNADE